MVLPKNDLKDLEALIEILQTVQGFIAQGSNMDYTHYESAQELHLEMEAELVKLQEGDREALTYFHVLFLPTAPFQELSMSNGWRDKYIQLAESFDFLYRRLLANRDWEY